MAHEIVHWPPTHWLEPVHCTQVLSVAQTGVPVAQAGFTPVVELLETGSQATQAALDLLGSRNALPTLDWALEHPTPQTPARRLAWEQELQAVDAALDSLEP